MEIYINPKRIKEENFKLLTQRFSNVTFIDNVENSYNCVAIIVDPDFVTKENLDKYQNLKWIQLYTSGYNSIDLLDVSKRNIILTNSRDIYSITIAEDVLTKILMINRNVKIYLSNMTEGVWKPVKNEVEIYGSTVGILGVGSIAKEIAKRMQAFGSRVIGYRKNFKPEAYFDEILFGDAGLDSLLKQSDYIVLALPLNIETVNLIDARKLSLMKQTSVLINISRGEIIVQEDLIQALKNKQIRAAGLDVTTPEPLPQDNELWKLDNVFITPHNSGSSPYVHERLTAMLLENINNFVTGKELINLVNE